MNFVRKHIRGFLAAVAIVASGFGAFWTVNDKFGMDHWLLWSVLAAWATTLAWMLACTFVGYSIVSRLSRSVPVSENLVVAFPVGVLLFVSTIFLVGLFGGLGVASFYAIPIAFFCIGALDVIRLVREGWPRVEQLTNLWRSLSWLELVAISLGAVALLLVYLPTLIPDCIKHDARWYVLPIAQQYAASGRIASFPEGWIHAANPQLPSLLYTWALTAPVKLPGKLLLASHVEFMLFFYLLAAVPVLVRTIALDSSDNPDDQKHSVVRGKLAWWTGLSIFLFPSFLVYNHNLALGEEFVAGIWAPSALLLVLRHWRNPVPGTAVLAGAVAAGAALTKYSAVCVAVPTLAVVVLSVLPRRRDKCWRVPARAAWVSVASALLCFIVITSQHWLKNWLAYGDPFYPALRHYLSVHPWNPDIEAAYSSFIANDTLIPQYSWKGLLDAVVSVFALGFTNNDYAWIGTYPTFGFLFPIAALIVFVVPVRRAKSTVIICFAALVAWYLSNHRDRYLMSILPWLAAVVAAAFAAIWTRYRWTGRIVVLLLVITQVSVSLDTWLRTDHSLTRGRHPLAPLMEYVRMGYMGEYKDREKVRLGPSISDWWTISKQLPRNSKVLLHEERFNLGLRVPVVIDDAEWQAGIHYGSKANTREIYDDLRGRGVTHIVTGSHYGDVYHSLAGELLFRDFLTTSAVRVNQIGQLSVYKMPDSPPSDRHAASVLVLFCTIEPAVGIYELSSLRYQALTESKPVRSIDAADVDDSAWNSVDYVLRQARCARGVTVPSNFRLLHKRSDIEYYVRD